MKINPLKQLYRDFMIILENTVIKYKVYADKYETADTRKAADAYINAMMARDNFNTYYRYDTEILSEVTNITDSDALIRMHLDRDLIPLEYRDRVFTLQHQKIIGEYEEKNNYYRMLIGLPNIEATPKDFIYLPHDVSDLVGAPYDVPVHMLDSIIISNLESMGYLSKMIEKYPDAKYLKFLGRNKMDLILARTAKNFSLLRIPDGITEATWNTFTLIYEQCRIYFVSCIYITEYRNIMDYYDNFIAMCIMVMTLQQIIMRVLKSVIHRDFFDEYCVQMLFETYGIPYNSKMDRNTKALMLQNLNILIQNKGTNKVIYDIASIFGFDRLKIFKYYLVKARKFDFNGLPIEATKIDPITQQEVPDYEKMYEIFFQKVALSDMDSYKSLLNPNNRVPYEEITEPDVFWIEDSDLYKEIYESEYNFVETKYMGVSISYRMTKILFENIYLLRMMLDKKDEIPHIFLSLPKISIEHEVSLFDTVILLCALTSKVNKLKGNILFDESKIMHVMGFNFETDFNVIKQEILDDPYLDDELVKFFDDSSVMTPNKINSLYRNFLDLREVLTNKMSSTASIEAYRAYKKLYDTMFYANENRSIFNIGTKDNPRYPKTFIEYLEVKNPFLYDFITKIPDTEIREYINHIINKMMKIIPDLSYLGIYGDKSTTLETMLLDLIKFFKSYTTDLLGLNIIYILDLKPESLVKLIDHCLIDKNIWLKDKYFLSFVDSVEFTSTVRYNDAMALVDKIHYMFSSLYLRDKLSLKDAITEVHVNNLYQDFTMRYYDIINSLKKYINTRDSIKFTDKVDCNSSFSLDDDLKFKDDIELMKIFIKVHDAHLKLFDLIGVIESNQYIKDKLKLTDKFTVEAIFNAFTNFYLRDEYEIHEVNVEMNHFFRMYDLVGDMHKTDICGTSFTLKDRFLSQSKLTRAEYLKMKDMAMAGKPYDYTIKDGGCQLYDASLVDTSIDKQETLKMTDKIHKIYWT